MSPHRINVVINVVVTSGALQGAGSIAAAGRLSRKRTSRSWSSRLQEPIRDPARLDWNEVTKVAHYYLSVDAMTKPTLVREDSPPYGGKE